MGQVIQNVMPTLIEMVSTILIAVIGYYGAKLVAKLNTNKNLSNVSQATSDVVKTTQSVVLELQQTCVADWKKEAADGKLTDAQIATLKTMLQTRVMAILSEDTTKLLKAAGSDLTQMIQSSAESAILEMKGGNSATNPVTK